MSEEEEFDVEEELQSAYHVLADKQAEIDKLRDELAASRVSEREREQMLAENVMLRKDLNLWQAEIESLRVKLAKDTVKLAKERDYYHDAWKEALKEIERMREEGAPRFEGKG